MTFFVYHMLERDLVSLSSHIRIHEQITFVTMLVCFYLSFCFNYHPVLWKSYQALRGVY